MNKEIITGIAILFFTYSLFSWALGRFINKRKGIKTSEFKSFLLGAWIIGLFIIFMIVMLYI
jgi:hypothetical protein